MPQGSPLRTPSLARRSSPAAADPSHTSRSPTPPSSVRACPIALTCWAHRRAGFAQLNSSSGLLTWALAHVGGAPPTPISRSRSADAVQDFVRDPLQDPVLKIPRKIPCRRSRARSVDTPPPPTCHRLDAVRRRRHPSPPPSVAAAGHLHNCHLPLRRRPAKHASYHAPPSPKITLVLLLLLYLQFYKCFSDLSCQIQSHYPRFFL